MEQPHSAETGIPSKEAGASKSRSCKRLQEPQGLGVEGMGMVDREGRGESRREDETAEIPGALSRGKYGQRRCLFSTPRNSEKTIVYF